MQKILIINGSYREHGIASQIVALSIEELRDKGVALEVVHLKERAIEFCLNCRECAQSRGNEPGECVIKDEMCEIIEKIEQSSAYIFLSPTNFGTVTAIFKRFCERLLPYAYWPWGELSPKYRKTKASKRALLITSTAMPSLMARLFTDTMSVMKLLSKAIGAKPIGEIYIGAIAVEKEQALKKREVERIRAAVAKLIK